MTIEAFSDGFDTLLNSHFQQSAFGDQAGSHDVVLDEYEKSFFLTKAQEEIVISLYTGRNSTGSGFEETEELRRYLVNLVKEATLTPITTSSGMPLGANSQHKFFDLPDDLWFITYESVTANNTKCGKNSSMDVLPVTQDAYHKIKNHPFRGANNRRVLRLDLLGDSDEGQIVEIISAKDYEVESYYIKYLKALQPILLTDLPEGQMGLEGDAAVPRGCELHEALHHKILERAVQMALQSKGLIKNSDK